MKLHKTEKQIVEDIFCLNAKLTNIMNRDVYSLQQMTLSSYIPLRMIHHGLETVTDMRTLSTETAASLSKKNQYLEKLGFINRTLDNRDKRKWIFTITPKGRQSIEKIEQSVTKTSQKILNNFSKKEKEELLKLLQKLEYNLNNSHE